MSIVEDETYNLAVFKCNIYLTLPILERFKGCSKKIFPKVKTFAKWVQSKDFYIQKKSQMRKKPQLHADCYTPSFASPTGLRTQKLGYFSS